jgi:ubiquinone/menaquinone biosynthesis C-methylase UbiE
MRDRIAEFLACPICRRLLIFEGKGADDRFANGYFQCGKGHVFQVKEEIGIFKDAKTSAKEFEWKVDVADERRYDEIRKQYDSYFSEVQKRAIRMMMDRLIHHVVRSAAGSDNVILDVATGMGTFILPLAGGCSEDAFVIGTDVDEKPLRGAMSKARKADVYRRLSFVVTDAKHLCFKNNSLCTVFSFFGFDNIPKTVLALKESARVLRVGGRMFFSSLWLKENSESMRLAEKHNVCQIATRSKVQSALKKSGLVLEEVEETYSGVWSHNPMDLLPVEGDEYKHVIVQARKPEG